MIELVIWHASVKSSALFGPQDTIESLLGAVTIVVSPLRIPHRSMAKGCMSRAYVVYGRPGVKDTAKMSESIVTWPGMALRKKTGRCKRLAYQRPAASRP